MNFLKKLRDMCIAGFNSDCTTWSINIYMLYNLHILSLFFLFFFFPPKYFVHFEGIWNIFLLCLLEFFMIIFPGQRL